MQQEGWEDEMRRSKTKNFQLFQVGSQTFLRSAQVFLLPSTGRTLLSLPFRFLPSWREIEYTAKKPWLHRLPAVLFSTIVLYTLMDIMSIGQAELLLVSFVSLAGLACFTILGVHR
jgi:hypothetical protein